MSPGCFELVGFKKNTVHFSDFYLRHLRLKSKYHHPCFDTEVESVKIRPFDFHWIHRQRLTKLENCWLWVLAPRAFWTNVLHLRWFLKSYLSSSWFFTTCVDNEQISFHFTNVHFNRNSRMCIYSSGLLLVLSTQSSGIMLSSLKSFFFCSVYN